MESLYLPVLLILILLIVLLLFHTELPAVFKTLRLGSLEFRRSLLNWRGQWSDLRGALFMAKGVDPAVGRDVGDMLPDADTHRSITWFLCLLAILIGNTLYFALSPLLPAAARMGTGSNPGLPTLVDLWFCILAFGVLSLMASRRRPNKPKK
jgi:hypothetical protein